MANPRVHEVAAELGISVDDAMVTLKTMGEFVRSPSSSLSPRVAQKLKDVLATRAARRTLLERKPSYPKRAPAPKRAPKPRTYVPRATPEKLASLESRAAAAAESQRLYEEEAATRRAADEAAGRATTPPQPAPPKKRRWVISVVSGGLPGLGRRR